MQQGGFGAVALSVRPEGLHKAVSLNAAKAVKGAL